MGGAQRSVRTRLTLDVNDYVQGTVRAEAATEKLGTNAGRVLRNLATGYAAIKLGGLITESVNLEAAYSKTMAQVAVATDAPKASLQKLDDLALKLGADTVFSAQDAASAMLSLSKGGLTEAQIRAGALSDTLTLASAGELELADAADTVVQAMGAFRLKASQTDEAVAALAGGANASSASVSDMTQALAQTGTSAYSAGLSIQETTAYLALFANQGFKGSDAGTSLRTMLSRLVPQTKEADAAMKALGLTYLDSNGNLVDATEIAKRTQDAFKGKSDAERIAAVNTIFGADAQRAINAITSEGDEGLRKYIKSTSDLTQAQKLADAANSGTAGSLESLKGAVETAQIQFGRGLAPVVQDVAAKLSDLAESGDAEKWGRESAEAVVDFAKEIAPLAKSALELGREALPTVAAAGATVVDVLKLAADIVTPLVDGFNSLPDAAQNALILAAGAKTLSTRLGPIPGLAGPAGASLFGFGGQAQRGGEKAEQGARGYKSLLTSVGGFAALTAGSFALSDVLDQTDTFMRGLDAAGTKTGDFATSFSKNGKVTKDTVAELRAAFEKTNIGKYADDLGVNLDKLATDFAKNGEQGKYVKEVLGDLDSQYSSFKDALTDFSPFDFGGTESDKIAAFRDDLSSLGDAYDEAAEKARQQALAVDENKNAFALVVAGLGNYSDALQGLPTKAVTQITTPGAVKGKTDVLALAEAYDLTPDQVETIMQALDFARPVIKAVRKALQDVDGDTATVTLTTIQRTMKETYDVPKNSKSDRKPSLALPPPPKVTPYTGMQLPAGYFGGGIVPGVAPSNPSEDNIFAMGATTGQPLMVRSGEWIINEKSSRENDRWLTMINRGLRLDDIFTIPGFAGGGRYDDYTSLTQSSKLDLLEQQQRIQQIEKSLKDRESYGKGKNKRTRLALRGLDRTVAEEQLKEERAELARMKRENAQLKNYGTPAQEKARADAEDAATEAAEKAAEERARAEEDQRRAIESASGEITGGFSLSGISSAAGLERALDRVKADSAAFTLVLADLAAAGASQWVLDVLKKAGPSKTSIKVGRELLKDTARLARISASSAQLTQIGGVYADLTAGSGSINAGQRDLLVSIQALDVTHVTGEIQRVVRHELQTIGAGANI